MEVYAIRVASRPGEVDISFSPLFVIRCYGSRLDAPRMPPWQHVTAEIPSSVTSLCRSLNAAGRPAFGAVACADLVLLCCFHTNGLAMESCDQWPDVYSLGLLKDQIQEFLDHVKAEFWRKWGDPYVRYSEGDDSQSSVKDEVSEVGDLLPWIPAHDGRISGSDDGARPGAGSDGITSMETSSAGSSDLDTDSAVPENMMMNAMSGSNGTNGIRHVNGVNEVSGVNGVNGVNGHSDIVMEQHENFQNTSTHNGNNPTEI